MEGVLLHDLDITLLEEIASKYATIGLVPVLYYQAELYRIEAKQPAKDKDDSLA